MKKNTLNLHSSQSILVKAKSEYHDWAYDQFGYYIAKNTMVEYTNGCQSRMTLPPIANRNH